MPTFTAYIDRDHNRKVVVHAATAAHARQYATSRYGKVAKVKFGAEGVPPLTITPALLAALGHLASGAGIYAKKQRKLRALGLIDEVNSLTEQGRAALNGADHA